MLSQRNLKFDKNFLKSVNPHMDGQSKVAAYKKFLEAANSQLTVAWYADAPGFRSGALPCTGTLDDDGRVTVKVWGDKVVARQISGR